MHYTKSDHSQRMVQHQSVLQCTDDPNPACVRYRIRRAHHSQPYAHFYFFIYYFHHNNEERFEIQLDKTGTQDCEASSHQVTKVNSPLKISKLSSVSKLRLSKGFQWVLLAATTVEIGIPVIYAMHDGQDLKHLLVENKII